MQVAAIALGASLLLFASLSRAEDPATSCSLCVDGPEMQRQVPLADLPIAITELRESQTDTLVPCPSRMTQNEMIACLGAEAAAADARLAAAVARYRERLTKPQLTRFDESQALWERYLTPACAFQASGTEEGSAAHSMVHEVCIKALTDSRHELVQELAECEEGDLACPAPR